MWVDTCMHAYLLSRPRELRLEPLHLKARPGRHGPRQLRVSYNLPAGQSLQTGSRPSEELPLKDADACVDGSRSRGPQGDPLQCTVPEEAGGGR